MADVYEELKNHFSNMEDVTVLSGSGAQGIKRDGKMFVMFLKGNILVKVPPKRVSEIIASGDGQAYDPGTGKPMKNRVLIPQAKKDLWIKYSTEANNILKK